MQAPRVDHSVPTPLALLPDDLLAIVLQDALPLDQRVEVVPLRK